MLQVFKWVLDDGSAKNSVGTIPVNLNKIQLDAVQMNIGKAFWVLLSTGHVVLNHLTHNTLGPDRVGALLKCADPDAVCPIPVDDPDMDSGDDSGGSSLF
jgi:hypothetical protein